MIEIIEKDKTRINELETEINTALQKIADPTTTELDSLMVNASKNYSEYISLTLHYGIPLLEVQKTVKAYGSIYEKYILLKKN